MVAMLLSLAAFGQDEKDDMYFNSKDRVKLNAAREVVLAKKYKEADEKAKVLSPINPTDSYSGRNVNPEYTNRLKTDPNQANPEPEYFVSGFQPTNVNKKLSNINYGNDFYSPYNGSNCGCGSSIYNPYSYNSGYAFTSPYSSFYPAYYGARNIYDPYGSFYGNPYGGYSSSMSMMMGYTFGGYSAGYNPSMMWGSPYWNAYYGVTGYRSGYGNSFYSGGSNYVDNGLPPSAVYGKRSSRSSELNNLVNMDRINRTIVDGNGRARSAGGRLATDDNSMYYQRGWRNSPSINSGSDDFSSGRNSFWTTGNSDNSWGRQGAGNTFNLSNGSNSRSSFGGSSGFSGGGRSGVSHSSGGARGRD